MLCGREVKKSQGTSIWYYEAMKMATFAGVVAIAMTATGLLMWLALFRGSEPVSNVATSTPISQEPMECDADAKICPDGSAVGRTGPSCEFAACPDAGAEGATLTTYLGGAPTSLNITVSPQQVLSDSRCAKGVQCIWAGTVEVRTVISSQVGHGEHAMKLGEPQPFGEYTVTLTEVTPYPVAESPIPESSYRFTYDIKKN